MDIKLDLILEKLSSIQSEQQIMKSQITENTQLLHAISNRQEETDAKLDGLSLDTHKIQEELSIIKKDIEFTYQKTSKNELELFKLRRQ